MIDRCLFIEIYFKSLMEVWCGKLIDYSNLKFLKLCHFAHIQTYKHDVMVVKCVFISYHEGVKRYKLWKMNMEDQILS